MIYIKNVGLGIKITRNIWVATMQIFFANSSGYELPITHLFD